MRERDDFTMSDELLTVEELAERLRVPVSWIYDKTRRKGPDSIPCLRVGKYLRFDAGAVMSWLTRTYGR